MSSRASPGSNDFHSEWSIANAAAYEAEEKILDARKRWARGEGELPTEAQVTEAQALREAATRLLRAASEDQMTRPAPLRG